MSTSRVLVTILVTLGLTAVARPDVVLPRQPSAARTEAMFSSPSDMPTWLSLRMTLVGFTLPGHGVLFGIIDRSA